MKRISSSLLALILLLGCFAGCSNKPDTESTSQPTQSAEPSAPTGGSTNALPEISLTDSNGVVYTSLEQKAVVKTALAYLARGRRIQYDDSRLNGNSSPHEYRWQHGVRTSPEEYTAQYTGYTNCAAFTHDVYLAALDYRIGAYTTQLLMEKPKKERIYTYYPTGEETAEEKEAVETQFRSNLQMADIIVIRYNGKNTGNGHAMLYVGSKVLENVDGYRGTAAEGTEDTGNSNQDFHYDIIHSTGSSYKYATGTEKIESVGTIQMMSVDSLFDGDSNRYVFEKLVSIAIVRPLNGFKGSVPADTVNRMLYMENVMAEKLSSHTLGMTANPGDEVSFTFSVTNKNDHEVTLPVKDTIPANTTYVSGADTVDGTSVSWNVTVPAGMTATVSYTVRVSDDAPCGDSVSCADGTVGGIPVVCPNIFIGHTLTADQQKALLAAVKEQTDAGLRGLALVNAAYHSVIGKSDLLPESGTELLNGIYNPNTSYTLLNKNGPYLSMVAPGMFGGQYVTQRVLSLNEAQAGNWYEKIRTRLPGCDNLTVGDVFVASEDGACTKLAMYLYTGNSMVDLLTGKALDTTACEQVLEKAISYNRFVILRPSLALADQ